MTHQPTLFDIETPLQDFHGAKPAAARKTDPPSSHVAAAMMNASGATADHVARIEAVVLKGGGWTGPEIAKACGLDFVQVARRLSTIKSIRKADASCDRKCAVTGKRLTTYWAKAAFEVEE